MDETSAFAHLVGSKVLKPVARTFEAYYVKPRSIMSTRRSPLRDSDLRYICIELGMMRLISKGQDREFDELLYNTQKQDVSPCIISVHDPQG
jgi:hypothetical protein